MSETRDPYLDLLALLKEHIDEFADPEFQQQVWIDAAVPDVQASFEEAVCGVYDDCQARYLIESGKLEELAGAKATRAVGRLLRVLDKVEDGPYYYKDTVRFDPHWPQVVAAARAAREALLGAEAE